MRGAANWIVTEGASAEVVFGPEEIGLMRAALEASWSALAFAHFESELDRRATREKLARSILEEAASGERRVPLLSGRALGALEPRRAGEPTWRASKYVS